MKRLLLAIAALIYALLCFMNIVAFGDSYKFEGKMAIEKDSNEFAIYKLRNIIDIEQLSSINFDTLEFADTPIVKIDDIITYNVHSHEVHLTDSAYKALCKLDFTSVFAVCCGKEPQYLGVVWNGLWSVSFNGIVIVKPHNYKGKTIRISLGYPSEKFFSGVDPRSKSVLINSLKQSGKLIFTDKDK